MRNYTLDKLKFIAAFFIIAVHIGYFADYNQTFGELFRVATRWALPFFFIVSGYFLGKSSSFKLENRLNSILGIFIVSSIVYLPYVFIQNQDNFLSILFSNNLIFGINYHLWYLSSLIIAFILVSFFVDTFNKKFTLLISLALMALLWISDIQKFLNIQNSFYFFRTLIGFPLVYIGYLTAKSEYKFKVVNLITIFIVSIFLMLAEVYLLSSYYNLNSLERQFPLFSFVAAYVLLLIGINYTSGSNKLAEYGKSYALGIYLYHLIFMPILSKTMKHFNMFNSFALLISTFVVTLIFLIILDKYFNRIFRILNGDIKFKT